MFNYGLTVNKDGECVRYNSGDISRMVLDKFMTTKKHTEEYNHGIGILVSIYDLVNNGCKYANQDFDVLSEGYDYAN